MDFRGRNSRRVRGFFRRLSQVRICDQKGIHTRRMERGVGTGGGFFQRATGFLQKVKRSIKKRTQHLLSFIMELKVFDLHE